VAYDLGTHFLDSIEIMPNYAVMFDIDDTLISLRGKPIKPIIKLLKKCNDLGVKVLIITARDSRHTIGTIEDLMEVGIYPNPEVPEFQQLNFTFPSGAAYYDFIYLRHSPDEDHDQFKSDVKKRLNKGGIFTVLSIGDNEIDINGNYSGYAIKLPNVNDPRLFHKDATGRMVNVKV
jgi:hypothetical protein